MDINRENAKGFTFPNHQNTPEQCGAMSVIVWAYENKFIDLKAYKIIRSTIEDYSIDLTRFGDSGGGGGSTSIWDSMPKQYKDALIDSLNQSLNAARSLESQGNYWANQANNAYSQGNASLSNAETAIHNAAVNLNNVGTQQAQQLQEQINQSNQKMDSITMNTYGTSAQDFFNKSLAAGQEQGAQMGSAAGNIAGGQAQQAARNAGMSRSAAAMLGAGQAGTASQQGFLSGFNTGQNAYQSGAASMNAAGIGAENSKVANQAQGSAAALQGAGAQLTGAQAKMDVANTKLDQASDLRKDTVSALGNEGGTVVDNGILKPTYKKHFKVIGGQK